MLYSIRDREGETDRHTAVLYSVRERERERERERQTAVLHQGTAS